MSLAFQGAARALSSEGLEKAAGQLQASAAEIWTVLEVETSGYGYLPDRRPLILYERHKFSHHTDREFDDGDISHHQAGGYGAHGAAQYERLNRAVALHRSAALRSASWGLGQVMGENFAAAGFADEEQMVAAMLRSEDEQLGAMAAFIASSKPRLRALQSHDWATFARLYNGKNYKVNQYDVLLDAAYKKHLAGRHPDLQVREAQLCLSYLGFKPGKVDGAIGNRTLTALAEFQKRSSFRVRRAVDEDALAELRAALPTLSTT